MSFKLPIQIVFTSTLILVIAVLLGTIYMRKETFVVSPPRPLDNDIIVQTCPTNTESYFDKNGDVLCCRGSVVNGSCNGITVCSLSSQTNNLPSCTTLLRNELRDKAKQNCPKSMPRYFQDLTKLPQTKGCTAGERSADGKKPKISTSRTCVIYNTQDENLSKLNSCLNIARSEIRCFNGQLPKLSSLQQNLPAVLSCSFTVRGKITPVECYTDDSLYLYLQKWDRNWRQRLNNSEKLKFCSVAKKYYVDKSLSDAQLAKYVIPDYTLQDILKQIGLTF